MKLEIPYSSGLLRKAVELWSERRNSLEWEAAMVLEVSETRGNEEQTLILRVFDPRGAVVDATVRARRVPEVAAAPQHRMGCWDWPTITVQA